MLPPTPPADVAPVYRTASPVLVTPTPGATPSPSPRPSRTPFVWRFGPPATRRPVSPAPAMPTGSPSPSGGAPGGTHDPVRYFTSSAWSCITMAGTPEEHRYTSSPLGFDLQTVFRLKEHSRQLDEHYRFNHQTGQWTVTLVDGAYVASAGPWVGPSWTLTGDMRTAGGKQFPVRMVYQYFDDRFFRRDFQVRRGDEWTTYSAETCQRAGPGVASPERPAKAPAPARA